MSILDRIKQSIKADIPAKWHTLDNIASLDTIDQESHKQPIVLFKHSVTCGISSAAKYRLESELDELNENAKFYYLDLLSHRDISNAIASRYGVVHQSPQTIIIKKGNAIYDTSHHSINVKGINDAISKAN